MAVDRIVKLGVAGLGGGARQMIEALGNSPGFQIVAAADRDESVLDSFSRDFGQATYSGVGDMCADPGVEAVYIATPNRFHTEHAVTALSAGKHVLMEKPMGVTLEQADSIIKAGEDAGRILMVSAPHTVEPHVLKAQELIESGDLGNLWAIQTWHYGDWLYRPRTPEELNPAPEYAGGVVFRQGPHQMDMIRAFGGGLVDRVWASVTRWDPARPVPGSYISTVHFANGVVATASYSGYDRFHTDGLAFEVGDNFRVYGQQRQKTGAAGSSEAETAMKRSEGYGGSGGGGATRPEVRAKLPPNFSWVSSGLWLISLERADIRLTHDGLVLYADDRQEFHYGTEEQGREEVIRRFHHAVATGEAPLHDGRWGKATEELLLAMDVSSESGKDVSLQYQCAPGGRR